MIRFFKEYFYFTRGERNGTFVLVTIMILVFIFPYLYNIMRDPVHYQPDPVFLSEIRAFYGLQESDGSHEEDRCSHPLIPGVQDKKADTVPESFATGSRQVIGTLKEGYENPFMDNSFSQSPGKRIDINSADTTELMSIRGIGPVLSRRILRYRSILGGYTRVSQLEEVYGLDQERFPEIEPFLYADTTRVVKLRLLSDEFSTLLRHPYLNYEQVSMIFRLRDGGRLNSPEDLSASGAFTDDDLFRLAGYLAFD